MFTVLAQACRPVYWVSENSRSMMASTRLCNNSTQQLKTGDHAACLMPGICIFIPPFEWTLLRWTPESYILLVGHRFHWLSNEDVPPVIDPCFLHILPTAPPRDGSPTWTRLFTNWHVRLFARMSVNIRTKSVWSAVFLIHWHVADPWDIGRIWDGRTV